VGVLGSGGYALGSLMRGHPSRDQHSGERNAIRVPRRFLVNVIARLLLNLAPVALILAALGCDRPVSPAPAASTPRPDTTAQSATDPTFAPSSVRESPPVAPTGFVSGVPVPELGQRSSRDLAHTFHELSEAGAYFFSDNTVSNETSYLQVATELKTEIAPGGAYLGVGPEQNFTYIALTRPTVAFIVDIRRDNALLHLLYKAIFHRAKSRAEFVALLLGRPYEPNGDPGVAGNLSSVLHHAQRHPPDAKHFQHSHEQLVAQISRWGIVLNGEDEKRLESMHRSFFDRQLGLKFELHETNGRAYPTLEQLLAARTPGGAQLGFLATRDAFETVQRLQRLHRILPVVGDFAGTQALQGVAKELELLKAPVSAFYVSNVEQYLFEPAKWAQYVANLRALPVRDDAVFIRCYLDQGRRHPRQLAGQRSATVLQPMSRFFEQQVQGGYRTFWQLATDT
jgi:hypothetical protein